MHGKVAASERLFIRRHPPDIGLQEDRPVGGGRYTMYRFRLGFWVAALTVASALTLFATDYADARVGGGSSFGSRGTRTFSAPPSTRTAPGSIAPIERSTTQPGFPARPTPGMSGSFNRPGLFGGGLLGGLAAGFLGAGLLGLSVRTRPVRRTWRLCVLARARCCRSDWSCSWACCCFGCGRAGDANLPWLADPIRATSAARPGRDWVRSAAVAAGPRRAHHPRSKSNRPITRPSSDCLAKSRPIIAPRTSTRSARG